MNEQILLFKAMSFVLYNLNMTFKEDVRHIKILIIAKKFAYLAVLIVVVSGQTVLCDIHFHQFYYMDVQYMIYTIESEEKVAKSLTIICNNKRYQIDTIYIFSFILYHLHLNCQIDVYKKRMNMKRLIYCYWLADYGFHLKSYFHTI